VAKPEFTGRIFFLQDDFMTTDSAFETWVFHEEISQIHVELLKKLKMITSKRFYRLPFKPRYARASL